MSKEENSSSGFRVVDRRPFAADGSRKEDTSAAEENGQVAVEPEGRAPREVPADVPGLYEDESARFETLVSYLSTTAMFQLGMIAGPSGERIPVDMPNAKRTLDLLEVLQEKTKGNLTTNESRLLDDVLYELRMTFVEVQKRQTRKTK